MNMRTFIAPFDTNRYIEPGGEGDQTLAAVRAAADATVQQAPQLFELARAQIHSEIGERLEKLEKETNELIVSNNQFENQS